MSARVYHKSNVVPPPPGMKVWLVGHGKGKDAWMDGPWPVLFIVVNTMEYADDMIPDQPGQPPIPQDHIIDAVLDDDPTLMPLYYLAKFSGEGDDANIWPPDLVWFSEEKARNEYLHLCKTQPE